MPVIQLLNHSVDLCLRQLGKVRPFRVVLSQQAVCVVIRAPLARAVWVTKISCQVQFFGHLFVLRKFAAIFQRQRFRGTPDWPQ